MTDGERSQLRRQVEGNVLPLWENSTVGLFDEVTGLCRTCKHAFIFQREHGERPELICRALFQAPRRMPFDVTKCSEYDKRGQVSLDNMFDMAIPIDSRRPGGQYL